MEVVANSLFKTRSHNTQKGAHFIFEVGLGRLYIYIHISWFLQWLCNVLQGRKVTSSGVCVLHRGRVTSVMKYLSYKKEMIHKIFGYDTAYTRPLWSGSNFWFCSEIKAQDEELLIVFISSRNWNNQCWINPLVRHITPNTDNLLHQKRLPPQF